MTSAWPSPSALASIQVAPVADTLAGVGNDAPTHRFEAPPPNGRSDRASIARLVGSSIARLLALTWCWTLVWLALWSVAPGVMGWSPVVVTSGSMEPALPIGSVVHIDDTVDLSSVGAAAIISFDSPATPGSRTTHRVTGSERDPDNEVIAFRTKGDANVEGDTMAVPAANVEGVGRLVVPYAGLPKAWSVNGDWLRFGAFFVLTVGASLLTVDTVVRFIRSDSQRPRRGGRRRTAAIAIAIAAMLGAPSTGAAFSATTVAPGAQFSMTAQWFIDSIDRNAPIAHWRLGEAGAGVPTVVMNEGFETVTGWNPITPGSIVGSTAQVHSGLQSGLKSGNTDASGAWKSLPAAIGNDFVLETWIYRPTSTASGSFDRVGIENSGFNGYGVAVDHSANTLRLDRRTGGNGTNIGTSVAFNPPEDQWYRVRLTRSGPSLAVAAFSSAGTLLASTTATDAATSSFDRVVVRGRRDYYFDDLQVSAFPGVTPTVAADRIGTLAGTYVGAPALGQPGLVVSDANTAVRFDGIDDSVLIGDNALINTTTRNERTVELWFSADRTTGRQVLYEEGGTVNGLNIYLDGTQLYATAYSNTSAWSNHLVAIAPAAVVVGTRYHVAVALDAVAARSLTMFVDGIVVASSTKTDSQPWAAHSDDGGIGALNGDTRFHDGAASGGGRRFAGVIDEVVLFNSILSTTDVANHHAAAG